MGLFSFGQVMVNGRLVSVPYLGGDMEVRVYGTIMFEVRFNLLGHILSFTPQNNEFQLQLSPKISASKTYGLCGKTVVCFFPEMYALLALISGALATAISGSGSGLRCWQGWRMAKPPASGAGFGLSAMSLLVFLGFCDENGANDFMLRDGTVTADWKTLVREWTVQQPGQTCPLGPEELCPISQGSHCQTLLSELFAECHKVLAPATFHAMCQQDSCQQKQVCEAIASYAHLCRTKGVCVDWRSPDFCGESPLLLSCFSQVQLYVTP